VTGHALEDDIRADDGGELYLVRPDGPATGPAIIYLHWFDESPTANRSQFLEEAREMARSGVVSALPQMSFPWHTGPRDAEFDLSRIERELDFLKGVHSRLMGVEGVAPDRLAIVGHDFGAMHGMLLASQIETRCSVFIAATPRWSDWFLRFWPINGDRYDYMRALSRVDPITASQSLGCPTLFQFAEHDFYIAPMTASELYGMAREPKEVLRYETDHSMATHEARSDRDLFLHRELGL
jgi:pimeloyl-ACP methyl ester carboxylesterase